MSYCVNCGVELNESERRCPLCGVEVINPAKPYSPNAERPFPASAENVTHRAVRVIAAKVLSLLLAIPFISVLLADLVKDGRLTWSLIPAGCIALFFMAAVFPCLFRRPRVWLFILFGTLETAAFLFGLYMLLGGNWYFLFALPVTLLTGAFVIGCQLMLGSKKASLPLKMIIVLVLAAVFVLVLQMLIELHLKSRIHFDWSLYAAVACAMLAVVVLIVGSLIRKRENVRKKLFF
ncbi:MAG: zinc ribbon domain-containing protein [Clostridia bacterium]|nr:zinc ribbon domain-containing protein [Clostridia bacterium]